MPRHQRLQDKTYDGYGEAEKFWRAAIFGTVKNDVTDHILPKILQIKGEPPTHVFNSLLCAVTKHACMQNNHTYYGFLKNSVHV